MPTFPIHKSNLQSIILIILNPLYENAYKKKNKILGIRENLTQNSKLKSKITIKISCAKAKGTPILTKRVAFSF